MSPGMAMKDGMRVFLLLLLLLPFGLGAVYLPDPGTVGHTPEGTTLDLTPDQGSRPCHNDRLPDAMCGSACTIGVAAPAVSPAPASYLQRLLPASSGMPEPGIPVSTLPPRV